MSGICYDDPDYQYLAYDKKKLIEEQNQPFDGKKNCWIPDQKEGYLKAEIISTKGDDVTVISEKLEVSSFNHFQFLFVSETSSLDLVSFEKLSKNCNLFSKFLSQFNSCLQMFREKLLARSCN